MRIIEITLSIDERVYEKFKRYCEERGLIISKQVELLMTRMIMEGDYDRV